MKANSSDYTCCRNCGKQNSFHLVHRQQSQKQFHMMANQSEEEFDESICQLEELSAVHHHKTVHHLTAGTTISVRHWSCLQ